jgi:type II secretory pathway pseudopilin PulG
MLFFNLGISLEYRSALLKKLTGRKRNMKNITNIQPKQALFNLQRKKGSTVTNIRRGFRNAVRLMRGEQGFALVESLVAVVVFGAITAAFFGSLSTGFKVLFATDERQTAKSLAESQLEYVKGLSVSALLPSYPPDTNILAEYPYYTVIINGTAIDSRDNNIQRISVIVSHQGRKIILTDNSTLEGFKVR